jgi:hypothetical protein
MNLIDKWGLSEHTAITRRLMRTARTLEAELRQVLRGSVSTGQRKMSQVLGTYFTMLRPFLAWRAFWNLWTVYFLNFPKFFFAPRWTAVNWSHGYWISVYGGTTVLYVSNLYDSHDIFPCIDRLAVCEWDAVLSVSFSAISRWTWRLVLLISKALSFTLSDRIVSCEKHRVQFGTDALRDSWFERALE